MNNNVACQTNSVHYLRCYSSNKSNEFQYLRHIPIVFWYKLFVPPKVQINSGVGLQTTPRPVFSLDFYIL
jgi:hypothetical protein